jgi:hypothetical protein
MGEVTRAIQFLYQPSVIRHKRLVGGLNFMRGVKRRFIHIDATTAEY